MSSTPRSVPLNSFAIPFGLLGLADCWLVAATFGPAPVAAGRVLVAVATLAWVVVGPARLRGVWAHRVGSGPVVRALLSATRTGGHAVRCGDGDEPADPIAGPFASLAVITPMLAAGDAPVPVTSLTTDTIARP